MENLIITEQLSKQYKDVRAVDSVSLSVKQGEIYGFLGLNGAGKTTTIRMMLGMIKPTSGNVFIHGKKVSANSLDLWKEIGYLVEVPYSYPNLTVYENLEIVRKLRKLDKSSVTKIIDELALTEYIHRKAKNLSLGNAQRLGLAKALIHNPNLLILDEPTNGLDPAGIHEIREKLKDLATNHGVTIFISSHILGEISKLADKISIIDKGMLIEELDNEQLKVLCKKRLNIKTLDNKQAIDILSVNGYELQHENSHIYTKDDKAIEHPEKLASMLVEANCQLKELVVQEEDLETFFLRTIKSKTI